MNLNDLTARNQALEEKPAHIDKLFANEEAFLGFPDDHGHMGAKIDTAGSIPGVNERPLLRKRRRLSNDITEVFVDETEGTTDVELITYLRSFEKPFQPITGDELRDKTIEALQNMDMDKQVSKLENAPDMAEFGVDLLGEVFKNLRCKQRYKKRMPQR